VPLVVEDQRVEVCVAVRRDDRVRRGRERRRDEKYG
jgi:hypothetical protein